MANKDVLVLNCKNCGEEFLYEFSGKGAKPLYCENCREKVTKEKASAYRKAYRAKMKEQRQLAIAERKKYLERLKEEQDACDNTISIIKSSIKNATEVITEDTDNTNYANKIAGLLVKLDTIRVELCSLATEMSAFQSNYDKNDQSYLHQLENIDTRDVIATNRLVREWKNSRNKRRDVKDLMALVNNTISTIPYKNYTNALPVLKLNGFKQQ